MAMIQLWSIPPDDYLTLIGRFIATVSHADAYIKQLFWKSSGIGHELGQLMTGGESIKTISKYLRNLYDKHCSNQLEVDDIESILLELSDLNDERNNFAHRLWHNEFHKKRIILSNRVKAKDTNLVEEKKYSIEDLEQLCIRGHIICGRILRHLVAREAATAIEGNFRGQFALPFAPWLDKSAPREKKKGKSRNTSQKPTRQHRSSRG